MSSPDSRPALTRLRVWFADNLARGRFAGPITLLLACVIGLAAGFGAVLFTLLIEAVSRGTVEPFVQASAENAWFLAGLWLVPALGLLIVAWFTRRFAPEAQGHGVPEVITAVARHDGVIRPRVALVKILASGFCIGTGGSIGREGPIVQIGSSLGSMAGQTFKLSPRHVKVLVAAGAAAGISATFHAPLAGVVFASEIILCSFAVESLTPIVVASVLADVVQSHIGEHRFEPAFQHLHYRFLGAWEELPSYALLGFFCGLAAVGFTKLLYKVEDVTHKRLTRWWLRASVCGAIVGLAGIMYYPFAPPQTSTAVSAEIAEHGPPPPPLFGVGYSVVDHVVHLENAATPSMVDELESPAQRKKAELKLVRLNAAEMLAQFWWILPLALLKPLITSITLGGGGSGGIFAPSLFIGATTGACFGLLCNVVMPALSANPGVYAIVGMGAVVAGTTHGTLSAILIVYEMTGDYRIILPIMITAGLSGVVARFIDPESIYHKKLSRRGESVARAHDTHRLEHVMVRDVMIRNFPKLRQTDDLTEIVRIARANSHIESLPVMDADDQIVGIIRSTDLHHALDSDMPPQLLKADDIALSTTVWVSPDENLLEALRDFGASDMETLPVVRGEGKHRRLLGLLLRSDAMRRYREEMLRRH